MKLIIFSDLNMNLFLLSWNPDECARYHCNKHVVKMILELCQMLYTAHHELNSTELANCQLTPYKSTHKNHPVTIWVRTNTANYTYTCLVGIALCREYYQRYGYKKKSLQSFDITVAPTGRQHKCYEHFKWLSAHFPPTLPISDTMTMPALAMFDQFKIPNDPITSYRLFYRYNKAHFAKYPNDEYPDWWNSLQLFEWNGELMIIDHIQRLIRPIRS